jgi:hypothetical protein
MGIIRFIACLLICGVLSSPAVARIWELATTTLPPKSEYPEGVDAKDFEGVLNAYNAYMAAFAAEDYLTMADLVIFSSKLITWKTKRDAIDDFSFIRTHILINYSHSEHKDVSFIAPDVEGGYMLFLTRDDMSLDGTRLRNGFSMYGFRQEEGNWKISSMFSLPALRSPF